jgi:hypothetical protein
MSDNNNKLTLKFRCPRELEGRLPSPMQASLGLPDWLKAMPTKAVSSLDFREEETVKRCPPFVDAMTNGFLIPLICDLRVANGEIIWDNEIPPGGELDFPRSPIGFHDEGQVTGTPLFEADRFSSSSTTCGLSKRRKDTRCSSRIPSTALICRSPR